MARASRPPRQPRPLPDLRGPLRRAIEGRDYAALVLAIRADCDIRPDGCWDWQRRVKEGYPVVRVGGKSLSVHRLACEARVGGPLGDQAAHHECANTRCVNPDHLKPVTAAANIAEMLARKYMVGRIRALESALRDLAPNHPALQEISVRAA